MLLWVQNLCCTKFSKSWNSCMHYHIITIFPELFESFMKTSIIGKAITSGHIHVSLYKLNNYSPETSGHIDSKAYWMHGQVLSPIPLSRAIEDIFWKRGNVPVIYMSPSWKLLDQEEVEQFSSEIQECIIICGHYEGIDQRIIDIYVDYEISIGNYIITWGELAAQVLVDSMVRLKEWVLWSSISHEEESFSTRLGRQKEYPVYTRPEIFMNLEVPKVLLSGNHKEIEKWKQSKLR